MQFFTTDIIIINWCEAALVKIFKIAISVIMLFNYQVSLWCVLNAYFYMGLFSKLFQVIEYSV